MTRAALILALVGNVVAVSSQAPAPTFEVASVKRNTGSDDRSFYRVPQQGQISITNGELRRIIGTAYGINVALERYLMTGGPADLLSTRFDITAKPPENAPPGTAPLMLRTLLAERFKLHARLERREIPAYALVIAREGRLGPDLRPTTHDCTAFRAARSKGGPSAPPRDAKGRELCTQEIIRSSTANDTGFRPIAGMLERQAGPLSDLLRAIQGRADRPIADATRLTGAYEWQFVASLTNESSEQPSLHVALEEQLGLKLEPRTERYEVLVIDSVQMPTED